MKFITLYLFALLFTTTTFASSVIEKMAPCTDENLVNLKKTIRSWSQDGYTNVSFIKNRELQTVGFYSWDNEGSKMYVEICDNIDIGDLTTSYAWYYLDDSVESTNPATWEKKTYKVFQDEGKASFTVQETSLDGNITARFKVFGFDWDNSLVAVRSEVVTFEKVYIDQL